MSSDSGKGKLMGNKENFPNLITKIYNLMLLVVSLVLLAGGTLVYYAIDPHFSAFQLTKVPLVATHNVSAEDEPNKIENGIHVRTGLVDAEGLMTVVNNCTSCHSAKIILQNRMTADRWNATIKWMQKTQNLGDLGSNQEVIVNYLVTNYPPKMVGRREILTNIDWYELKTNNN